MRVEHPQDALVVWEGGGVVCIPPVPRLGSKPHRHSVIVERELVDHHGSALLVRERVGR
jgi:hypothetical protein